MAGSLWVLATLIAAAAQTARNTAQSGLTAKIGTLGATQVRFVFGLPFALVFLGLVALATGEGVPALTGVSLAYTTLGAVAQIGATALMLVTMKSRSFAVTTAWIKTEPVMVALIAAVTIGDALTPAKLLAIVVATAGVVILSTFLIRASTILVVSLALQSAMLLAWLAVFDRRAVTASFGVWRTSLLAGFLGAFASQFWFIGFSLTTAANVRTLALVEVIMALGVSAYVLRQPVTLRQKIGMAVIILGVGLLLTSQRPA